MMMLLNQMTNEELDALDTKQFVEELLNPDLVQSTAANAMQLTTGTYRASCPALQQEQLCHSMDEANDVCWSMHEESDSYAFVEDYLGHGVIEYGDLIFH